MRRHPTFGLVAPELGWVPAPSYLLRRERVLAMARVLLPGRLLEVGCGAGALLADLRPLGFECRAFEPSARAREIARTIHQDRPAVEIAERPAPGWAGAFDVVVAFEVLEHIESDRAALIQWRKWLKAGGSLLLSVPAHRRRWSASDEWAGHYRRYDRADLESILEAAGFVIDRIECYGFPLSNLILPLRAAMHRRRLRAEGRRLRLDDAPDRSHRSGIERPAEQRLFPLLASPPGRLLFRLAVRCQEWTLDRDWGTGYLALSHRPFPDEGIG